jgi:trigger factor
MDIVKKNHGQRVMGEVLEIVVDNTSREALQKEDARPALRPNIEITSFEEGKDLVYKMAFEVLPEVPAVEFDKIKIERPKVAVTDTEVNEALEKISGQAKDFAKVDRAAKNGDAVQIDFKGFVDGEAFEGGEGKDFQLELGSNQFIPGFEEQLVGKKAGDDVKVDVSFPEQYHSEALAGKKSVFEVQIHEVKEAKAAEIDDELASKMGFEDLPKLKEAIKTQIATEIDGACRTHAKKALFDALSEQFTFDVPEQMEQMEFDTVWKQVQQAKEAEPEAEEFQKSDDELKKEYKDMANRRVKLGILLSDLGGKNEITVDQEEVNQAVFAEARQYPGQEQKVFEYYRDHPENLESLKGPILEEKVVDFILEKVSVTDKEMSVEDLQKL